MPNKIHQMNQSFFKLMAKTSSNLKFSIELVRTRLGNMYTDSFELIYVVFINFISSILRGLESPTEAEKNLILTKPIGIEYIQQLYLIWFLFGF